jgi:UTP:GlnB (protein PII) uridylyltransferase
MQIFSQPYRRDTGRLSVTLTKDKSSYMLVVDTLRDAPGTLHRLSAVLYRHDWNVNQADICTMENNQVIDKFLIRPIDPLADVDEIKFEAMMKDFERLLFEDLKVADYVAGREPGRAGPVSADALVEYYQDANRTYLMLCGQDRPGLLLSITEVFVERDIDILEARIQTAPDGAVRNTFLLNPTDRRFTNPDFLDELHRNLHALL